MVTYHLHAEVDRAKSDYSMMFSHKVNDQVQYDELQPTRIDPLCELQVVPGVTPMAHYGLELVKAAKLPADVLTKAAEVSSELDQLEREGKKRLAGSTVVKRRKALLEVSPLI